MSTARNLLPLLRGTGVPQGAVAAWTPLQLPEELAKLDFGKLDDPGIRTRIQSIPSPWARLLLFRAALDDEHHPARRLVANELLDALEFLWSLGGRRHVAPEYATIRLDELLQRADYTGSPRAVDFAKALQELAPRGASGRALQAITIVLVGGRPVLATSPFTGVFTAEDAAMEKTGPLFRYAATGEDRPLARRPEQFQRYLAAVVLPQLREAAPPVGANPEWASLRTRLGSWLKEELRSISAFRDLDAAALDYRSTAASLELDPIEDASFGGLVLYRRRPGAEVARSRWRLRSQRGGARAPLILDSASFNGELYEGATRVSIAELGTQDRSVLPGLGESYPWISPAQDWMSQQLLLLNEPLETENVRGLSGYRVLDASAGEHLISARLTLPLRGEFFRYFAPEDVDQMLNLEVRGGRIEATLRVPVGTDDEPGEVIIRKVYGRDDIKAFAGPELAVWPTFEDERWDSYVVYRRDVNSELAQHCRIVGLGRDGQRLESQVVARTPLVHTLSFRQAPAVLEIHSHEGPSPESLGVVVPRYRGPATRGGNRWHVGVDFGTSNTVIGVRENESETVQIFGVDDMSLSLTQPGENTLSYMDAYFFPPAITSRPFGTAVVAFRDRPRSSLAEQPVGAWVTVPYGGQVFEEPWNQVAGDLKWSVDEDAYYLSSSFLRHVLATVLAAALQRGIDPARISISWAYPRAFTPTQLDHLRNQWEQVVRTFRAVGVTEDVVKEALDESRSVLRYFFNTGQMHVTGSARAILDVGGGTTDIAAYGSGRVLTLDSVMLGGRNLTGRVLRAATPQQRVNRFVAAFFDWAVRNHLPQQDEEVIRAYLAAGEVHLAFSYLVGTRWFAEGEAAQFAAQPAFQSFQLVVLYFFGALFHYLGLSFRSLGESQVPHAVVLGGNGSRYLDWLTNLKAANPNSIFRTALARVLVTAAGAAEERAPVIEISSHPKAEVASGLAAKTHTLPLDEAGAVRTPLVGEAVSLGLAGGARSFEPISRFSSDDLIHPAMMAGLTWADGELEIERFHRSLVQTSRMLREYGGHWEDAPGRYEALFARLSTKDLREDTIGRMEYLATQEDGFRGSIFMLEVSAVLDRMLIGFFEERP
jgi:hypothetical protein